MPIPPTAAATTAALLWGFTYILTTTMRSGHPWFNAAVRGLGGGLPLLFLPVTCRRAPGGPR